MLKTLGIVQGCFRSPRFRANAMRRLDGRPVLEWVIRRVSETARLDGVIVVADKSDDSPSFRRVVPSDVPIFFGDGKDPLARFAKALEQCHADGCIRVLGDNLFVDPGLLDRLITTAATHPDCDYVTYCSQDGRPAIHSPVNVFGEWFRTSALRKANRLAQEALDRHDATRYLYSHPEKFKSRLIPAPSEIDRDDVRLIVDIEEDWDHVMSIFDALGPERLDWQRIARLLDHQPAMRDRMATLNRQRREAVTVEG